MCRRFSYSAGRWMGCRGVLNPVDSHARLQIILNQCSSPEGATACSIAIAGINILCKQSVIDMKTTIKVLAPKCSRDRRPLVLEAYIKLLGLAPSFKLTGSEYHSFLIDNVNW